MPYGSSSFLFFQMTEMPKASVEMYDVNLDSTADDVLDMARSILNITTAELEEILSEGGDTK